MSEANGDGERLHTTVPVCVRDFEADIDVEIAGLIEQLWLANIRTVFSCQENEPGVAWIEFDSGDGVERFMSIVAGEYDGSHDSLYSRMFDDGWKFEAYPDDLSVYRGDTVEVRGEPDVALSVSIRFPCSDIAELERRMREYNEPALAGADQLPPLNEIIEQVFDDETQVKVAALLRERGWTVERRGG